MTTFIVLYVVHSQMLIHDNNVFATIREIIQKNQTCKV